MGGAGFITRSFNRYFPADKPVRRVKLVVGFLFVLAVLTLFLPYFRLEYPASDGNPRGSSETFTGVQYMTGSYHSKSPDDAEGGALDVSLVVLAAVIGLATLPSRRHRAIAFVLVIVTVITLLGGCASTQDLHLFGGGPTLHVGYGFVLGALLLVGAAGVRVLLWLSERAKAAPSGELY
jgi:hypothetical protein